jgi:hypothetical protein
MATEDQRQNLAQSPRALSIPPNEKSAPQPTAPMLVSGGYCQHTEGLGEMA